MKRFSIMLCAAGVLTMSACQQALPPEVAAAVAEAEKKHGHVCNDDMLSCELGICPVGRARRAAFEALEAKQLTTASEETSEEANTEERTETKDEETEKPITPSAEQMESARNMMQEPQSSSARRDNRPEPANNAPAYVENNTTAIQAGAMNAEPVNYVSSSPIPGRGGLRMGHFAPPEEAVSTSENSAPRPNAAERHGLRSPSLPGTLPMTIDGRTNAY